MVQLHRRTVAPDVHEPHRTSTPTELFFDLTLAVAVSQAASWLRHSLDSRHFADAFVGFPLSFFAVWWAWMNLTGSRRPTTPTMPSAG